MHQIQNIKHVIANLVTEVALSFPVSYINSITFLLQGNLVAKCDWKEADENSICINILHPAYYTQYHSERYFSEIEVKGIDTNGLPFRLFSPAHELLRSRAA
ncbi:MAG: hypothetical protein ACKVPJ_09875 [Chitinophagales bacterium]